MGSAIKILPHYTYADYCQWEGRWELIEGIPHSMIPVPNMRHQWVSANMIAELRNAVKKTASCQNCKVYNFIDVVINEHTVLQPDIAIACNTDNKQFLDTPPALVAEILSPSTALKDRHVKYDLYEQMGVAWYLIIDMDKEMVEVYRLVAGVYQSIAQQPGEPFTLALADGCTLTLDWAAIWQ
jgi:Uma2 family endonuclease